MGSGPHLLAAPSRWGVCRPTAAGAAVWVHSPGLTLTRASTRSSSRGLQQTPHGLRRYKYSCARSEETR